MTDFQKSKLPFNIVSSSVDTTYMTEISSGFKPGVDIVGHHQDTYAGLDNEPLQTTFTRTHVGGNQHRHVPLNSGNDNDYSRPEAFKIKPESSTLKIYGPDFEDVNKPRAQNWVGAKSPINISNIETSGNIAGNFEHNYQVVQTVGRRTTNNLVVDGFIASGNLTTQFITGANNHALPDISNNSKSIFVERFNAPGGKEESSRGALDRAGEELSPNNSLTTRNIKVRQPFYSQLTQHSPQFGSGSTTNLLPATGNVDAVSIHKTNRNTRKEIRFDSSGNPVNTNKYDNFWIQHAIPASNFGYAWITASVISNPYTIGTGSLQFAFTSSMANTGEVNIDTQTLVGSLSASQQWYGTWEQIRTGEHPVAQKQRETNIIAVQDPSVPTLQRNTNQNIAKRSGTSTNFKETPVTVRNHPINQELKFVGSLNTQPTTVRYTFKNNSSWFANDDLQDRLGIADKPVDFYEKLVTSKNSNNSIIQEITSLSFKDTLYPKEVNTFLSGTRSRAAYITDQPGFDRDGYDRQLGTQRVFWRDNQEDRRRSANSSGGHINSLGYSSLEESGSNFTQNDSGILFDNSFINHSASLTQNFTNLDKGINNSIIPLESGSSERELYTYTGSFKGTFYNNGNTANKVHADIVKRGYTSDIAGEFNNSFVDFYEQFVKDNQKQSIGSIYRNTSYKEMINSLPVSRENLPDVISRTDDESVFVNPKPRYVAFVGGGELNTGSVFDNSDNFTNEYFNTYISGTKSSPGSTITINCILPTDNKIYFGGSFTSIGGVPADYIAVYDKITQKFSPLGTSSLNSRVNKIAVSGTDLYIAGNFTSIGAMTAKRIARYNTTTNTWSEMGGGLDAEVQDVVVSGADIYVGGFFTTTGSRIARWSTIDNSWYTLAGGLGDNVYCLAVSGTDIYVGGEWNGTTEPTGSRIARWSTIDNSWYTLGGGLQSIVYSLAVSGTDIYAGGLWTQNTGSRIARWSTVDNSWYSLSGGLGNIVNSIVVSGNDIYAGGLFSISTGSGVSRWSTLPGGDWTRLSGGLNTGAGRTVTQLHVSGNYIYAVGSFTITGSGMSIWSTLPDGDWSLFNTSPLYSGFSKNILNISLNSSDIKFSTLDNGLLNKKTKTPTHDSSEDYYRSDIYQAAKDYSIIPEFRISEHIVDYINNGANFQSTNNQFLTLDGVGEKYKSADSKNSNFNKESFLEKYSFTEPLNKQKIETDYTEELEQESISLNVSAIKKLLPYNGFYPQERTIQLANLYSDYINNNLAGGVYNLNNINDYYNDRILSGNYSGTVTQYVDLNLNIDVEKYNNKYFLVQNTINTTYLYSSSNSSYKDFSQNVIYSYENHSGSKFISASNGLNIYSFSCSSGLTSSYNHLSSNGINWSSPAAVIQPYSASDGFGEYWDYIYENNSILGEKIFFSIASPYVTVGGKSNCGVVSFVSATMKQYSDDSKYWEYSDKITLGTGSAANNRFGTGISMISCSSGYQVFMGEILGDTNSTNFGNIWVTTSSNGQSWSTPISIVSGTVTSSSLGFNNIKAVNFEKNGISKSYVFFTEPLSSGSSNVSGKLFVISSSFNNNWGTTNLNSTRTELYAALPSTTISGTLFDLTGSNRNSIQAYSNNNSITYCYVNSIEDAEEESEIIIGATYDGINWQTNDQLFRQINGTTRGFEVVGLSTYEISGNTLPVFFTNLSSSAGVNSVYASHNNQYTQFTLNVSGVEKYVKQAALEPVMAPGILYNTIKSGIAVDWPCITGSQTSIQPYGSGTIVNAYYPQSFKMASHQGNNIDELNMYGNLRSNIDYRVDFEKLIFPDQIFPSKPVLTSSLTETTNLTSLSQDSQLVQFISGCYVYGGYEPYTSPVDFSDYNQLGPKRFSVPFVYKKEDAQDNGLYSLAMSNFLAESVKFFLKNESLTTFASKNDGLWGTFTSGTTYYMDILLGKTADLVMMEAYHDSKHPTGPNGEKMNGRYFGYPVNKTNKKLWSQQSDDLFTDEEARLIHNDPAYAPYTPPYFEGPARLTVSFTPSSSNVYKFDDIISNLKLNSVYTGLRSAHTASDAYINKMSIESSVKIDGISFGTRTNTDGLTEQDPTQKRWTISTKFETPVLDFSSQSLTPYENNYSKTSGYGRGMWSGYGEIPGRNKGIYISLQESQEFRGANRNNSNVASLLQKVGFTQGAKKIGRIAETKTIKEAVMIVPFIEKLDTSSRKRIYNYKSNNNLTKLEIELGIQFIGVNKKTYERVIKENIQGSILDTVNKMKEFIIPPQLDYVKNNTIDPFVAYIAEFTHELTQQDLADIWQGVSPSIANVAELKENTITHPNSELEFFHGEGLPKKENIRFMVFKIKQKGEFDYFKVTADSSDDELNRKFTPKIPGEKPPEYGYNWPYDFFSLVELAKLDVEIKYKKKNN